MLPAVNQLSLVPLGAGDLIDRAVRLYRRHFITLVRIAAPPVIVSTVGSLMVAVAARSTDPGGGTIFLILFGLLIQIAGLLLNVIVIGGAARNLITHLLWNEPFSARTTYRNVRARFGSLFGASILIALWIAVAFLIAVFVWLLVIQIFLFGRYANAETHSWLATVLVVIWILAVTFLAFLLFFLMVKFIVYVPQVLMIEGRGVFDSIGRSFSLAKGNLRRLMAMFLFYWFATWSALALLILPLLWYGYAQGVNINPTRAETWPMWYAVGYSVLTQVSGILLVPVLILGLSIMYIDERVRQEGYDIELIAARQLVMPNQYGQPNVSYGQYTNRQPAPNTRPVTQHNTRGPTFGVQ